MKRLLLIVITMVIAPLMSRAQLTVIPKIGATVSKVAFSDEIQDTWDADFWPKAGFVGGIALEVRLSNALSLQPELLWSQKGFYYEYEEPLYSEAYNVTLNYLELPVLLKARTGPLYFAAGPSIAYGISGRYNGSYTENEQEFDDEGKVKFGKRPDGYNGEDEYVDNAFDVGVQVGLGVMIKAFVIDLRYGMGLANLYDEGARFTGDVKSQNRCLQLTLGYALNRTE